jgi:hypothetical protein
MLSLVSPSSFPPLVFSHLFLSYGALDIGDGAAAVAAFTKLGQFDVRDPNGPLRDDSDPNGPLRDDDSLEATEAAKAATEAATEVLRSQLLCYCELDTRAMVELHRAILHLRC